MFFQKSICEGNLFKDSKTKKDRDKSCCIWYIKLTYEKQV